MTYASLGFPFETRGDPCSFSVENSSVNSEKLLNFISQNKNLKQYIKVVFVSLFTLTLDSSLFSSVCHSLTLDVDNQTNIDLDLIDPKSIENWIEQKENRTLKFQSSAFNHRARNISMIVPNKLDSKALFFKRLFLFLAIRQTVKLIFYYSVAFLYRLNKDELNLLRKNPKNFKELIKNKQRRGTKSIPIAFIDIFKRLKERNDPKSKAILKEDDPDSIDKIFQFIFENIEVVTRITASGVIAFVNHFKGFIELGANAVVPVKYHDKSLYRQKLLEEVAEAYRQDKDKSDEDRFDLCPSDLRDLYHLLDSETHDLEQIKKEFKRLINQLVNPQHECDKTIAGFENRQFRRIVLLWCLAHLLYFLYKNHRTVYLYHILRDMIRELVEQKKLSEWLVKNILQRNINYIKGEEFEKQIKILT